MGKQYGPKYASDGDEDDGYQSEWSPGDDNAPSDYKSDQRQDYGKGSKLDVNNSAFTLHGDGISDPSKKGQQVSNVAAKKTSKGKVVSSSSKAFAKGGNTKMFGKQAAGPQKPGQSASLESNSGGRFAKGGKTKMFGKQNANTSKPGVVTK